MVRRGGVGEDSECICSTSSSTRERPSISPLAVTLDKRWGGGKRGRWRGKRGEKGDGEGRGEKREMERGEGQGEMEREEGRGQEEKGER